MIHLGRSCTSVYVWYRLAEFFCRASVLAAQDYQPLPRGANLSAFASRAGLCVFFLQLNRSMTCGEEMCMKVDDSCWLRWIGFAFPFGLAGKSSKGVVSFAWKT